MLHFQNSEQGSSTANPAVIMAKIACRSVTPGNDMGQKRIAKNCPNITNFPYPLSYLFFPVSCPVGKRQQQDGRRASNSHGTACLPSFKETGFLKKYSHGSTIDWRQTQTF